MPKQKDLKRLVRSRMKKTGESYTAARRQITTRTAPTAERPSKIFAHLAGITDDAVSKSTGRNWSEWVRLLDREGAADRPHREITQLVSTSGVSDWWSQMVTVGYERIRGLRAIGQRRGGLYEATKSRTFSVPIGALFEAFADESARRRWLDAHVSIRTARRDKSMRLTWEDDTIVAVGFLPKGPSKSMVAIQHQKLPSRSAADAMKNAWTGYLNALQRKLDDESGDIR